MDLAESARNIQRIFGEQVEKRVSEWIEAAHGTDFRQLLEDTLRECANLREENRALLEVVSAARDLVRNGDMDYSFPPDRRLIEAVEKLDQEG